MKLHKKYEPFIRHTGRFSIITGGRGSGKSFAVAHFIIKLSFESGHKIQMLRRNRNASDDSTIAEVQGMIDKMELSQYFTIYKNSITNNYSGSEIIFDGVTGNNKEATARNKGKSGFSTIIFEEAEEFTDVAEFNKINLGLRDSNKTLRIIFAMNPTTKEHWIYKRFFAQAGVNPGFNGIKNNVCYVHTTYLDIYKHLNQSTIEEIEYFKKYESEYYNQAVLGGWLEKSEGVIFSNWEYGDFPNDVDSIFGADWGFSKDPDTLIEVYVDKKEQTIYLKEHLYQNQLSISEVIKICSSAAGDKLIIADYASGGDRLIEELKSNGIKIQKCVKGAGSVNEGIKLIQGYKLIVEWQSHNLAKELDMYAWKKNSDTPVDSYNHLLDAMRYAVTDLIKPKHSGIYHIY